MTEIETFLKGAAATITNGASKVGFVHLNDVGLSEKYYLLVPSKITPEAFSESPIRDFTDELLRQLARTLALNDAPLREFCKEKGIPDMIADAFGPCALMARAACVTHGGISNESKHAIWVDTTKMPKYAEDAARLHYSFGAMLCVMRAVNHINTNHCTTGQYLPDGQLKAICSYLGFDYSTAKDRANHGHITSLIYFGTHACHVPFYCNAVLGYKNPVGILVAKHRMRVAGSDADLDDWTKIRVKPMPAGTHVLSVLVACLRVIEGYNMLAAYPYVGKLRQLAHDIAAVKAEPLAFHPGAGYFGAKPRSIDKIMYSEMLIAAGKFVAFAAPNHTIMKSPSLEGCKSAPTDPTWSNLCINAGKIGALADITVVTEALSKLKAPSALDWTDTAAVTRVNDEACLAMADIIKAGF